MNKFVNFLTTVTFSLSAGILIGLLIAPDSGKRTRKKLMRRYKYITDDLEDLLYNGGEIIKDVKDTISDLKDTAETTVDKLVHKK